LYYRKLAAAVCRGLGRRGGRKGKRGVHKLRDGPSAIGNANGLRWRILDCIRPSLASAKMAL
jgi:hypothetical protein